MGAYADLTNVADILKTVYGEGLTNQFKDERTTYNMFPKSDRKPGGAGYTFGLRIARTQSTGARAESSPLPDPFTGKKTTGTIIPIYLYGTIRLTGPMIEKTKRADFSFVEGLADEIDDIYQSMVNDFNRQAHGDGFGLIATVTGTPTPSTSATWAVTCDNDTGVMYAQEGMLVDFYNSTAIVTTCAGQRILSVNPSTKVLIFETSVGTYLTNHPIVAARSYTNNQTALAAGYLVCKVGAKEATHASTNTKYEMTGLQGLFDDGTLLASFEGVTVASQPKWMANLLTNSSVKRELSLDLMMSACELTRVRSGMNVNRILMGLGQKRKYANLLLPDVRFQPGKLIGGYETVSFAAGDGTVEITYDPMTAKNKMYFMPNGIIQKFELTPLGWGDLDGDKMHRRSGYDEWELFLRIYTQLGVEQRDCLTMLGDLVEP